MTVSFRKESLGDWISDASYILNEHWLESNDDPNAPLDLNHDTFIAAEKSGFLHIIVGRDNGKFVAYWLGFVFPNLHYKTKLLSDADAYWIDPRYNRGIIFRKMIRYLDTYLQGLGVSRSKIRTKPRNKADKILELEGYKLTEHVMTKIYK